MNQGQSFRVLSERGGQRRCPYCHGDIVADEAEESCEVCAAGHHQECWDAHGGCSACGQSRVPIAAPSAASSITSPRARTRQRAAVGGQAHRLGGRAPLRTQSDEHQSQFEWGSNATDAGFLRIGGVALLGLTAILLMGFAIEALPLALLAIVPSLVLVGPILFLYSFSALAKSRRLIASDDGLDLMRYDFWAQRTLDTRIDWRDITGFELTERPGKHEVRLLERGGGELSLGVFPMVQTARRLVGLLEQARARFGSTIDPRTIRVQRRPDGLPQ